MESGIQIDQLKCPKCQSGLIYQLKSRSKIQCISCLKVFQQSNNFYDFIHENSLNEKSLKEIRFWEELIKKERNKSHNNITNMNLRLKGYLENISGSVLEIGFGAGADLKLFSQNINITKLIGVDLISNGSSVAESFKNRNDVLIIRADTESLPLKERQFDYVYSYSVIHHTKNPLKSLKECRRVMTNKGKLLIYVYSSHEGNILKRIGILGEKFLIDILRQFPQWLQISFCGLITPCAWILFSIPSKLIRSLGFKEIANQFPFHWAGNEPYTILPDIKDRLLSPANHRYTKKSLNSLLSHAELKSEFMFEDHTGIYCVIQKIRP